jgi:hypothetical protein
MILGLDVSTSITGATLLDDNGNIVLTRRGIQESLKTFLIKQNL